MNVLEKLKRAYSQNDEEFLEVSLFEKSKASECFYDELNLDLYNLCNILYRGFNRGEFREFRILDEKS